MPTKTFVTVFKNVSTMKNGDIKVSPIEEHFNVPWNVGVKREQEHLGLFLDCQRAKNGEDWSMDVLLVMNIISLNGRELSESGIVTFKNTLPLPGRGIPNFIKWDDLQDYVIDDTLTVEVRMTIMKMTGIKKKNLKNFDESMKEFSDVVLVAQKKKFHLSKLFLAEQSSYFKTRLLKSKKSEFPKLTFKDVKATHLQNFLEVLYGESSITESTIDGILVLADKFKAQVAIQECEQFLINVSKKTLNGKLELAHLYELENLKNYCLSKMTTVFSNITMAHDISEMDPAVLGVLLQQSLAAVQN